MKIIELFTQQAVPHKNFFQLQEVANLLKVKPHEIKHWETELPQVRALKSKSGQRIYRREDVLLFFALKTLIYEKKLTVAGAQSLLVQADEHFFASMKGGENEHSVALKTERLIDENDAPEKDILKVASTLLSVEEDDDEFDDHTQQIYQRYGNELEAAEVEIEPMHVGEMLHDALAANENEHVIPSLSKSDYERAFFILMQSKDSLLHLLSELEKYREPSWFLHFDAVKEQV